MHKPLLSIPLLIAMVGKITKKLTGLLGLLTLLLLILSSARCDDEKPFASQLLTFILPATILPSDSIALVGDTLWITADVPDSLLELNTGKKYRLPNYDFGQTSIVIRKLIDNKLGLGDQGSAANYFDFIDEDNQITFPGETFVDIKFIYDKIRQSYQLRIGIIPTETGVFCIYFLSPQDLDYQGILDLGKHENGATIFPVYEDLVFPINKGANNFELFKKNCLDGSQGSPESYRTNYRYVTFTFRVTE
jgi:hypothetical protein